VRKVSQKGDSPEMRRMGRVSTPGVRMSKTMKEMPPCLAVVSVRTRQNIQSALSA
jgi:ribosomal protein S8